MKKGAGTLITLDIRQLPEGAYLATSTDVQGLVAQGKTFEETVEIAEDVAATLIRESRSRRDSYRAPTEHIIFPILVHA